MRLTRCCAASGSGLVERRREHFLPGHRLGKGPRTVSNRHLIQAIHRPASETLTHMTGVGTCDGSGQVTSPHSWLLAIGPTVAARPCLAATATGSQITGTR